MNLNLKLAILKNFRNQADFAKEVGLSETVLSRIIMGRRMPTPEQKRIIAEKLGASDYELFQDRC